MADMDRGIIFADSFLGYRLKIREQRIIQALICIK